MLSATWPRRNFSKQGLPNRCTAPNASQRFAHHASELCAHHWRRAAQGRRYTRSERVGRLNWSQPAEMESESLQAFENMKIWRKRVGVEPTILAAKDRINGFEGHEGHRTPFASDAGSRRTCTAGDYTGAGRIALRAGPASRISNFGFSGFMPKRAPRFSEFPISHFQFPIQLLGVLTLLRASSSNLGSVHTS